MKSAGSAMLATLAACALVACGARSSPNARNAAPAAATPAPAAADPDAWRAHAPNPGERVLPHFPVPEVLVLKNGLTVYVVHKPSAISVLGLVVRHGATAVPLGKSGLAGLTARMLTEGTTLHSSLALAEATEALGTTLESDASRDDSHVSLTTLVGDLPRGLELLAEVVTKPAFDKQEFERVRAEWLDNLRAERQEPAHLAALVGLRALLGPTAGASVAGSIPDVSKLKVADLVDFHRQVYVPPDTALVLVGDLTLDGVRADVERLFGRWSGKAFTEAEPSAPASAPKQLSVLCVDRPGAVQSSLFAVQGFPKRSEPGYEAREVLGVLLGGLFTSRLNQNLREKHAYTYGVHAQAVATRYWGVFFVGADVKTEVTSDALAEVLFELKSARDADRGVPIRADEAERARTDLMHGLGARLEYAGHIADAVRTMYTNGLELSYFARYPSLLDTLSTAAVTREAARLDPEHLRVVIVGDRAKIDAEFQKRQIAIETAPLAFSE